MKHQLQVLMEEGVQNTEVQELQNIVQWGIITPP